MPSRPKYSVRVEHLMRECGWRDEDLAVAAGISARTVANVRCGRGRSMRAATASVIAAALSKKLGRPVTAAGLSEGGPRAAR